METSSIAGAAPAERPREAMPVCAIHALSGHEGTDNVGGGAPHLMGVCLALG